MQSFEQSTTGIYGDILSHRKERRPIRVGLLTCGYFEYWRMYPARLKEDVQADMERVTAHIRQMGYELVCSGMVDTLDSADAARQRFRDRAVDAVIVVMGTYVPDFISLRALEDVGRAPVLFFSTQTGENVDVNGDYEHSLRNSGIIGLAQLSGTFCKLERRAAVVVGSVDDPRAYRQIQDFLAAVQAVEDVREANIGVIGHVFRGMYDLELSKTFLKRTFGVNVINIQSAHLLDAWEAADEGRAREEARELFRRFASRDVTQDDGVRALRLYLAMDALCQRFRLNALCFLDQHFIQRQTRTSARMGASLLMERRDITATCEGDLGGLIMMMMMRSISGRAALMGEWGEFDMKSNSCLIMGHGIGTPDLAAGDDAVTLTPTPEEWGFDGAGLNYELILRPGAATLGHFLETPRGYRMMLSPAASIPHPTLRYCELHAMMQVRRPVKEYLETLLTCGVAHHVIAGLSDMTGPLHRVADILGLETLYIE